MVKRGAAAIANGSFCLACFFVSLLSFFILDPFSLFSPSLNCIQFCSYLVAPFIISVLEIHSSIAHICTIAHTNRITVQHTIYVYSARLKLSRDPVLRDLGGEGGAERRDFGAEKWVRGTPWHAFIFPHIMVVIFMLRIILNLYSKTFYWVLKTSTNNWVSPAAERLVSGSNQSDNQYFFSYISYWLWFLERQGMTWDVWGAGVNQLYALGQQCRELWREGTFPPEWHPRGHCTPMSTKGHTRVLQCFLNMGNPHTLWCQFISLNGFSSLP